MSAGRYQTAFNQAAAVALPASAAETVVLTTPILFLPYDNMVVLIAFFYNAVIGANNTAWVCKVKQGVTTGGTQVGTTANLTVAAAANGNMAGYVVDTAPGSGGQQYCLTISATAATAVGTGPSGTLVAMVL